MNYFPRPCFRCRRTAGINQEMTQNAHTEMTPCPFHNHTGPQPLTMFPGSLPQCTYPIHDQTCTCSRQTVGYGTNSAVYFGNTITPQCPSRRGYQNGWNVQDLADYSNAATGFGEAFQRHSHNGRVRTLPIHNYAQPVTRNYTDFRYQDNNFISEAISQHQCRLLELNQSGCTHQLQGARLGERLPFSVEEENRIRNDHNDATSSQRIWDGREPNRKMKRSSSPPGYTSCDQVTRTYFGLCTPPFSDTSLSTCEPNQVSNTAASYTPLTEIPPKQPNTMGERNVNHQESEIQMYKTRFDSMKKAIEARDREIQKLRQALRILNEEQNGSHESISKIIFNCKDKSDI